MPIQYGDARQDFCIAKTSRAPGKEHGAVAGLACPNEGRIESQIQEILHHTTPHSVARPDAMVLLK